MEEFDDTSEIRELVLDRSASDSPSPVRLESTTRLSELTMRILNGMSCDMSARVEAIRNLQSSPPSSRITRCHMTEKIGYSMF